MNYFSFGNSIAYPPLTEHASYTDPYEQKLLALHETLIGRMRLRDIDLTPYHKAGAVLTQESVVTHQDTPDILTLSYFRSPDQAKRVEDLMDIMDKDTTIDICRHPVIEIRLTPESFAVELVLSPSAWWDQQNLVGKLEIDRQQQELRRIVSEMASGYCFGFWEGLYLNEMHLTNWELAQSGVLREWMNTFADGVDWLRFGKWYALDSEQLDESCILEEVMDCISELYRVYEFIVWSSNNNYQPFYEKRQQQLQRKFA